MIIAVVDGKGGGIGCQIVERLRSFNDIEIIALGTNSQATSNMLKAGADDGATGENAVVIMSHRADIIVGPLAIIAANSMMGEITPRMAEAISSSRARKILLPVSKCNIDVVGVGTILKALFNDLTETLKKYIKERI